ncbi:MAG: restriction endonuclease subunit R [Flavobacteriales bacterium]|nr:MAG: restriction endonuclease subunit R [Flavobacteriales bacterium]
MLKLNLPTYEFKIKRTDKGTEIFDKVRKKYVALKPEEWVRQHFIHYLIGEKNYPASLLEVEKALEVNRLQKRSDIVAYNNTGQPQLIVECKAPSVKISQKAFDQIARYNIALKVKYLVVTNGLQHYCCKIDFEKKGFEFLKEVPGYESL